MASFVVFLQQKLTDCNRTHILAGLFGVLRSITKSLKHNDIQYEEKYMHISMLYIHRIPWIYIKKLSKHKTSSSTSKQESVEISNSVDPGILWGTIFQLFCSLIRNDNLKKMDKVGWCSKFADLIPVILHCCFSTDSSFPLQYLRHKILVLMTRLCFYVERNFLQFTSWLKLLDQYFGNLLYQTRIACIAMLDNSLEGSPFAASLPNGASSQNLSVLHLQRQAVYLFFRCCFASAFACDKSQQRCSCGVVASFGDHSLQPCSDYCSYYGLSRVIKWFCDQYNPESIGEMRSPSSFAICFLRLFMEEDDMLFSMLWLLLDAPRVTSLLSGNKMNSTSDSSRVHAFSEVFGPAHLLHILLMLLHYDHLVIVDYLISKDTGVDCAKYMLRCLRVVSQSFHTFVDSSVAEVDELSCKRQKTSSDLGPFVKCSKHRRQIYSFENAKGCLHSLKKTLEDLHHKNLFPYNPMPLLRSLSRFLKICEEASPTI